MRRKPITRLVLGLGGVALLLMLWIVIGARPWSPVKISDTLPKEEARRILQVVATDRAAWVRRAIKARDFPLLRRFIFTRTYSIGSDPEHSRQATVLYGGAIASERVYVHLWHDPTNGWEVARVMFVDR